MVCKRYAAHVPPELLPHASSGTEESSDENGDGTSVDDDAVIDVEDPKVPISSCSCFSLLQQTRTLVPT